MKVKGGNGMQTLDQILPIVAVAGAIIVVLLYLYYVRGMFQGSVETERVNIPSKLRNIKKLADAGKYGAAITLAYRTFEQMCGSKMGSERLGSETAHEYMLRMVKELPIDGEAVEEFLHTYEEARFSHHEMTRDHYEFAIKTFTDLYPRVDASVKVKLE